MDNSVLREIPKVEVLLNNKELTENCGNISKPELKEAVRSYLEGLRADLISGKKTEVASLSEICSDIISNLSKEDDFHLRKVINATGVILHTNLGRAPLGKAVSDHFAETVKGYCNLEYDLKSGGRGQRNKHIERMMCDLFGVEAAIVVNNNAAAVFLMLNEIARGHKVAISRGELVEIGGSFRVPDIMSESGAELIETGTTNKTKPSDYISAIEDSGADILLKVDTGNFKISGFTESVEINKLVEIGEKYNCKVLYDLGSGFLVDREMLGLHFGKTIKKITGSGVDVVTFSGDKLMGSAQAGIIAGKKEMIDRMRRNSLMRILRPDKMQLAVLEMTLKYYKNPQIAIENIPALSMFAETETTLKEKAESLLSKLKSCGASEEYEFGIEKCRDVAGGGSLPDASFKGYAVCVSSEKYTAEQIEERLRFFRTPIITRITDGKIIISLRTLCDGDEDEIVNAFVSE